MDDEDEDWYFISQAIIDHRKKKISRSVKKLQRKVKNL